MKTAGKDNKELLIGTSKEIKVSIVLRHFEA